MVSASNRSRGRIVSCDGQRCMSTDARLSPAFRCLALLLLPLLLSSLSLPERLPSPLLLLLLLLLLRFLLLLQLPPLPRFFHDCILTLVLILGLLLHSLRILFSSTSRLLLLRLQLETELTIVVVMMRVVVFLSLNVPTKAPGSKIRKQLHEFQ